MNLDVELRAENLRERIKEAFADVPMPTCEELVGDGSLDEISCAEQLGGVSRDDIPADDLWNLTECLMWMPAEAVRYYLPRFLTQALEPEPERRRDGQLAESLFGHLDRRQRHVYHPDFSLDQRRCVADWIAYLRDYADAFDFYPWRDRIVRRAGIIHRQWSDP